jgi:hypothetical protein
MLILAHGQPKSGSTFLFQIASGAADLENRVERKDLYDIVAKTTKILPPEFVPMLKDEMVDSLMAAVPQSLSLVLKVHGPLCERARTEIENGRIRAFTSFRDPRDIAVSLRDVATKQRNEGKDNFFTSLHELDDMVRPIRWMCHNVLEWAKCKNVIAIPFYLIALERERTIDILCAHLGFANHIGRMRARFHAGREDRIGMFGKGIADRFLEDLKARDIDALTKALEPQIKNIDVLTRRWMDALGSETVAAQMLAARDKLLHGVGIPMQPDA